MKKLFAVILAAGLGFATASLMVSNRLARKHAAELAEQQAAWQADKAALETALAKAKSRPQFVTVTEPSVPATSQVPVKLSPAEIVAKLRSLKLTSSNQTRTIRQALYWLEELLTAGPSALPAIKEFLARNEEIDFDLTLPQGRGGRGGSISNEFILPPSLRFGLFDVVKQIGGDEAEKLLAEVLSTTGRGVEIAWLARILQDIAPNKYRDTALNAARELLARAPATTSTSPLDRNDRDNLFSVLMMYGDASFAGTAQSQLLRADGQVDRSALKYLQQSLGVQSVAVAAQMYEDPRLTDPAMKEPFARLALYYVGADEKANEFYQKAINDLTLTGSHRSNLIEDLNEDGFPDLKNLSARDLPLIQNRITLIEQLAPSAADKINEAAFKEAYKDLVNMRARIA